MKAGAVSSVWGTGSCEDEGIKKAPAEAAGALLDDSGYFTLMWRYAFTE
jgi:hypothetical protein